MNIHFLKIVLWAGGGLLALEVTLFVIVRLFKIKASIPYWTLEVPALALLSFASGIIGMVELLILIIIGGITAAVIDPFIWRLLFGLPITPKYKKYSVALNLAITAIALPSFFLGTMFRG